MSTPENYERDPELQVAIYDADVVSPALWEELRFVHQGSLASHLDSEDFGRIRDVIPGGSVEAYRETRVNPQLMVERGLWTPGQRFAEPQVTVVTEARRVVGGVVTANNTSPGLTQKLKLDDDGVAAHAETWLKMKTPPGLALPVIGGKRYVHLRELYTDPKFRETAESEDRDLDEVTLAGLYFAFSQRHIRQTVAAYRFTDDPIDAELVRATQELYFRATGISRDNQTGFQGDQERVVRRVEDVLEGLRDMDESLILPGVSVKRVTAKTIKADEKAKAKHDRRVSREYDMMRRSASNIKG